jgi:hypothetical protein
MPAANFGAVGATEVGCQMSTVHLKDVFAGSDDDDGDFAESWQPEPGEKLAGTITGFDSRDGGYGEYPIVTVEQEGGERAAVHAYHAALKRQLGRANPAVGDPITITYAGKVAPASGGNAYHSYTLTVGGE